MNNKWKGLKCISWQRVIIQECVDRKNGKDCKREDS